MKKRSSGEAACELNRILAFVVLPLYWGSWLLNLNFEQIETWPRAFAIKRGT
jgi:hypothetical protein